MGYLKLDKFNINEDIIKMFKFGHSIDFIAKRYYKYKNKNVKPIKTGEIWYFPPKIYNMEYCRMYVTEVIYDYLTGKYVTSSVGF